MSPMRSALYQGVVNHARLEEPHHAFSYPVFSLLLDIDELPALDRGLRLFRWNRPGLLSFHDRDHLDGAEGPLRPRVEALLRASGVEPPGGRIELLTSVRVLGYVFNPVSFFWCYDRDGVLRACVAEVNNTFGDRHPYVLPVGEDGETVWHRKKLMHVSPFFPPDAGTYRFDLPVPGAVLRAGVDLLRAGRPVLLGGMRLARTELSDRAILGCLARYPLVTLKVVAAIHYEALRLWLKRARVYTRPPYDPEAARGGPA